MFDAASTPYVSETQTRHMPMTGTHTHDHAAFGHPDHDDGVHSHTHTHDGDADHDHADQHDGTLPTGRGGGGERVSVAARLSGNYGQQMNAIGPVARRRLKDQQLAEQDARR
jgi:ABC-type Zn2+ transport system substrate-binding protein/surface adhesin